MSIWKIPLIVDQQSWKWHSLHAAGMPQHRPTRPFLRHVYNLAPPIHTDTQQTSNRLEHLPPTTTNLYSVILESLRSSPPGKWHQQCEKLDPEARFSSLKSPNQRRNKTRWCKHKGCDYKKLHSDPRFTNVNTHTVHIAEYIVVFIYDALNVKYLSKLVSKNSSRSVTGNF